MLFNPRERDTFNISREACKFDCRCDQVTPPEASIDLRKRLPHTSSQTLGEYTRKIPVDPLRRKTVRLFLNCDAL
jgi:hypothetical protein